MKKIINIASIVIIIGAIFQILYLHSSSAASTSKSQNKTLLSFNRFPLNEPKIIDFEANPESFAQLTPREQADQLRDWLLFTVVSEAGLSAEAMNESLFDLPSVRYGYMRPVANFEYADTRSVYIGEGRVISLVPPASPQKRLDDLADIADKHRKNMGQIPQTLLVFEYKLDMNEQFAVLTHLDAVDGASLFTQAVGYHEQDIHNLNDLEAFMPQIDDVTYAHVNNDFLTLGGRDLQGREYRNIKVEDVAAVWQSEHKIQTELTLFESKWQKNIDEFNNYWANKPPYRTIFERQQLEAQRDAEWAKLETQMSEERAKIHLVNGSGFSLDPTYDYEGLKRFFDEIQPTLQSLANGIIPTADERFCDAAIDAIIYDAQLAELKKLPMQDKNSLSKDPKFETTMSNFNQKLISLFDEKTLVDHENTCQSMEFVARELKVDTKKLLTMEIDPSITSEDILQAKQGLVDKNIDPLIALFGKLKNALSSVFTQDDLANKDPLILLTRVENNFSTFISTIYGEYLFKEIQQGKYRFQAARYDGDLKGTEVGMVLYYTDLLAKLWALDYSGNAPKPYIEDFRAMTQVQISPIYKEEIQKLPSTRLWFGHQYNGFQVADKGKSLLMARTATRVYAASSDPYVPGKEMEPNAQSESFLGWWNNHYDEVARYEPEYQRLNEIMKWSLIIGWLNEGNKGNRLNFLKDVKVIHDRWFPEWVQQHHELKFQDWDEIKFYPKGYLNTTTEALPRLKSEYYSSFGSNNRQLSGGVSLASKDLFNDIGFLSDDVSVLLRRSNLKYNALEGNGIFSTFDDVKYAFSGTTAKQISVVSTPKEGAKLRGMFSEMTSVNVERTLQPIETGINFETRMGGTNLGILDVGRSKNGFSVGWMSRDIDSGQSLARKLSISSNPGQTLLDDAAVLGAIKLDDSGQYLVKITGSNRWLKLAPEEFPSASIQAGWQSRVAANADSATNYQLAWLDDTHVAAELGEGKYIAFESIKTGDKGLAKVADIRGPPTGSKALELHYGDQVIKAHIDDAGTFYARWEDLPDAIIENPRLLQQLAKQSKLPDYHTLAKLVESQSYDDLAQEIAMNPQKLKGQFNEYFADSLQQIDNLMANKQSHQAIQQLDELIKILGPEPELVLRRAEALIKDGNYTKALNTLDEVDFNHIPSQEGQHFFDVVNESLKNKNLSFVQGKDQIIDLTYHLDEIPVNRTLSSDELLKIRSQNPILYVQDSPSLNNLDWYNSLDSSLDQLISGNLGKVIKLPSGKINNLNVTQIYAIEGTKFHLPQPSNLSGNGLRSATNLIRSNNNSNHKDDQPIYIVVENHS